MTIQPNTDMSVTLPGWLGMVTSTLWFCATKAATQVAEADVMHQQERLDGVAMI